MSKVLKPYKNVNTSFTLSFKKILCNYQHKTPINSQNVTANRGFIYAFC